MRRRAFIMLLGGVATAIPYAAIGQQIERARRIGVLMTFAESDPEGQARIAAFRKGLAELGWAEGQNIEMDCRWATTDRETIRRNATELVALKPDLIVAHTHPHNSCDQAGNANHSRRLLSKLLVRSAAALSPAWRGRAAM